MIDGKHPEIRKIRKKHEVDEIVRSVAEYYGLPEVDSADYERLEGRSDRHLDGLIG